MLNLGKEALVNIRPELRVAEVVGACVCRCQILKGLRLLAAGGLKGGNAVNELNRLLHTRRKHRIDGIDATACVAQHNLSSRDEEVDHVATSCIGIEFDALLGIGGQSCVDGRNQGHINPVFA